MCCVEAAEEYARNRESNCDGGVARRRIVVCVSGAASKNRERGSFVFFSPVGIGRERVGTP